MRPILSIASKELRALFQSQTALLFLALFLIATNLTFFVVSHFFARNIADLAPLFDWLPINVIVLVSAVAMRAWAEEQRAGTLEILLTLPVHTSALVLGKFVAGMALVGIALATTLPLAVMVANIGPLDWGPVFGGYLGGLLLAAAYLSIGLCISARTDNQVVALMGTVAVGGLLYAIGSDNVQSLLGSTNGQMAALLGTGSRFESIARGVVDLRDVAYYGSITVFFLVLNGYFLDRRRIDPHGSGARHLLALRGMVLLSALNAVALNVWLHPIRSARIDLTENQDYTISDVTRTLLDQLDEPLLIQGVFSERSHPKLQPLAPQLATLLEEYANVGGKNVLTELLDPSKDEDLATRLEQDYGIRPIPMPTADRNETRIVNSWFHVLIRYGDQNTVVNFSDLVEIQRGNTGFNVKLRDPEYDITKAIRRVTQDFATTESLVAKLPTDSKLYLFASPASLDDTAKKNFGLMNQVAESIAKMGEPLTFVQADPTKDPALAERIAEQYAVRPVLSFQTGEPYYLHLVLDTGSKAQRIFPSALLTRKELEKTLHSTLQRAVPGQLKTLGFYTEEPVATPAKPNQPAEPAEPPDYHILQQLMGQRFEVEADLDLSSGSVPDHIDALIVGKPGPMSPMEQLALEQFLLRGGSVIALAGRNRVAYGRRGFVAEPEGDALFEMLSHYGANVLPGNIIDAQSGTLALPVRRKTVQFDYPYWLDVRPPQMLEGHVAFNGIPHLSMPWTSAVELADLPEGVEGQTLFHSTSMASLVDGTKLMPNFERYPQTGFPPFTEPQTYPLAVTLTGRFPSFFSEGDRPERAGVLEEAVAEGRLVVLGSSEMVGDVILKYATNPMGRVHANNHLLIQNLVDWAVEDTDLLSIRNAGSYDRALAPLGESAAKNLEYANYAFGSMVLAIFFILARRRRPVPPLPERSA